ncbi:rhamnulokinase [Puniceicoccales bacterium CK1056]|uniref:Rhamnulokinase n=1 Tax=Oceanipulchritudo coccoides TaxID=2706888 RepID=A0A6B2M370_9BACT|nr:FGGY-family carbohydrate kinase [Oceanipulchritudo coccoides]NDV62856.1 rhamnulokinase [Oceanipulchritudo coccoides]
MTTSPITVAAVDMGATSGRVFRVRWDGSRIDLTESHRFTHGFEKLGQNYYWQPGVLFREIVKGIQAARREASTLASCGVDFWGVDHALLLEDGRLAHPVYSYRDERTRPLLPKSDSEQARRLYEKTGIPIVLYNSSFQLMETLQAMPSLKDSVKRCLFLPDYFNYLLSGSMLNEVSIASTSQLLSLDSGRFDTDLMQELGIPDSWFFGPVKAGKRLGNVVGERGLSGLTVSLVPGHDTSCAFEGAPGATEDDFIVSTGTWCLAGCFSDTPFPIEKGLAQGISHERCGNGNFRPTKILLGLWLVEKLLESFQAKPSSAEEWMQLDEAVSKIPRQDYVIDTADEALFNPKDMKEAIDSQLNAYGHDKPQTLPGYLKLAAESIAQSIADSMDDFESSLGRTFGKILVIGGGAKNAILCKAISERSGRAVHAYPTEAAIIGNAAYQLKAMDAIDSVEEIRAQLPRLIEARIFS